MISRPNLLDALTLLFLGRIGYNMPIESVASNLSLGVAASLFQSATVDPCSVLILVIF